MVDQDQTAEELLLDVKVAEASRLYKFYLNQEKKILGTAGVATFLLIWELVGNTFQLINRMFMSAPSLIWNAAAQLFASGEIYNDLYLSGVEFFWGYLLSVIFAIPFGIMVGWYKRLSYIFDPFINAINATPLILTGLRLGIGRALVSVVVGELYARGYRLYDHSRRRYVSNRQVFVGVLIFALSGMVSMEALTKLEQRFDKWRPKVGATQ